MKIQNYRSINKGALVASFDVVIPEWALTIRDCTLFKKEDRQWVGLPSRSYKESDGTTKHFPYLSMDKEAKERFDQACIKLMPEPEVSVASAANDHLPF